MAVVKTGNKTHDDICTAAEGVRQVAVATAANQAAARQAEITFYQTVAKSCRANLGYSGVEQANSALRELGGASAF